MNKNFALHFSSNPGWVIVSFFFFVFFFFLTGYKVVNALDSESEGRVPA